MASQVRVHFYTDSDAFHPEPEPEIARILRAMADRVEEGRDMSVHVIRDADGELIGKFEQTDA